jgi:hypothetical protein
LLAITVHVPVVRKVTVAVPAPVDVIEQTPTDPRSERVAVNPLDVVAVTAYVSPGKGFVGTAEVIVVVCGARATVIVPTLVMTSAYTPPPAFVAVTVHDPALVNVTTPDVGFTAHPAGPALATAYVTVPAPVPPTVLKVRVCP